MNAQTQVVPAQFYGLHDIKNHRRANNAPIVFERTYWKIMGRGFDANFLYDTEREAENLICPFPIDMCID